MRPPVAAAGNHLNIRNFFNDAPLLFREEGRCLAANAEAASPGLNHALEGITDPSGDFLATLATFASSASSADLGVVATTVACYAGTQKAKARATA